MIEADIKRGKAAQDLLDNPLLTEILDDLRQHYIDEWLATEPSDVDARERLYLSSRLVDEFRQTLRVAVENGKITKAILQRKEKRAASL